MRMPRVRFTILRLMLVVAGVGTILGAYVPLQRRNELQRRQDRFLSLARHHEAKIWITTWACEKSHCSALNEFGEDVSRWPNARKQWHIQMAEKYRHTASDPWMPVEPDPPPP